jgi:predicted metal-dependent hydrolase
VAFGRRVRKAGTARSSVGKEHEDLIALGDMTIPYRYRHSSRRTLGISVRPDHTVIVTVPRGTSLDAIRDFVRKRADWIIKAWRHFEQLPERPALKYVSGETHRYVGAQYRLQVNRGRKDSVEYRDDCLMVTSKNEPAPERIKAILESWYRSRAAVIFHERLLFWHGKMAGEGVPFPKLRIRRMKTRWGSWSSTGRITLNLLLMTAPVECIDYVVVHELCHFKFKGHGPRFWNAVGRFMPDYKERRKRLKMYGG